VPPALVVSIERAIGAPIVGTQGVHGGMSSGPAASLSLADGRQLFAKTIAAQSNSKAHVLYARELEVLRLLPADVRHAPLVAGVNYDDWLSVVTEASTGPAIGPPWRWQRLYTLLAMASGWRTWTTGGHLVHLDARRDNVVPRPGGAWLIDWAHAATGVRWIDHAGLAVDVVASGHVGGERVGLSAARGTLTELPYEATRFVVAMAGMFRRNPLRDTPPAVPGLRAWQAERARALRPLVERLVSR
jgi:hypothetical protein